MTNTLFLYMSVIAHIYIIPSHNDSETTSEKDALYAIHK